MLIHVPEVGKNARVKPVGHGRVRMEAPHECRGGREVEEWEREGGGGGGRHVG